MIAAKHIQLWMIMGLILAIYACSSTTIITQSTALENVDESLFSVPDGWPEPVYDFSKNPLSTDKIALGRKIFYDPILSRDSTISCASCHLSFTAFTHTDHDLSHGIEDRIGTRNSSALINLAWSPAFMWDGAINHLDMQALAPIAHKDEMDFDIKLVVDRMNRHSSYQQDFFQAWGSEQVTGEHFLKSMSQFLLTLVTANSKYDQVMRQEAGVSFTVEEQRGLLQFREKCESCHKEPLFTDYSYQNNGLPVDPSLNDYGRLIVTGVAADSLKFKVPSLRNIEYSDPYMHDGRFRRLKFVMRHYGYGMVEHETLAPQLRGKIDLTPENRTDLISFLKTLTDKEFLRNEEYSFPRLSE